MDNVRITYLRDKNRVAFGVLAVRLDRKNNTISYGLSVCHSKEDVYSKTTGVHIAVNKLNKQPLVIPYVRLENMSAHEITRHVMYDIVLRRSIVGWDEFNTFVVQEGLPTRVRKYAKAWLRNYNQQIPVTVELEESKEEHIPQAFDSGFASMTKALERTLATAV